MIRKYSKADKMPAQSTMMGFTVKVYEVKDGSEIPIGLKSVSLFQSSTIGRGEGVDFRIPDRSVSREHVRITQLEGAFLIESISKNGTTFVNSESLEAGDHRLKKGPEVWLQLGRILLLLEPLTETIPVSEAFPIPTEEIQDALIIVREGPNPEVWFGGKPVSLSPQAAKMLRTLCSSPRQIFTYDELGRAIDEKHYLNSGGLNYVQLATYIRNVIIESLDQGIIRISDFDETLEEKDARIFARNLVRNVRSVGYLLDTRSAKVLPRSSPSPRKKE